MESHLGVFSDGWCRMGRAARYGWKGKQPEELSCRSPRAAIKPAPEATSPHAAPAAAADPRGILCPDPAAPRGARPLWCWGTGKREPDKRANNPVCTAERATELFVTAPACVFSFPGVIAHPLSVHALSNPLSEPALSGQGLISARLISACQLPVCLVQKLQPVVKSKCRTCSCWLKSSPELPEQHSGAQDRADQGSPQPNPQSQRPRSLVHRAPAPHAAHLPVSSWGQRTRRSGASACPGRRLEQSCPDRQGQEAPPCLLFGLFCAPEPRRSQTAPTTGIVGAGWKGLC